MGHRRAWNATLEAELQLKLPIARWLEQEPELQPRRSSSASSQGRGGVSRQDRRLRRRASFHQYERYVMLQSLDAHWREHLAALDHLRQGIHLRGYAQKNPKQEYKREAFELFGTMVEAGQARGHQDADRGADPHAGGPQARRGGARRERAYAAELRLAGRGPSRRTARWRRRGARSLRARRTEGRAQRSVSLRLREEKHPARHRLSRGGGVQGKDIIS